jgi:hypothetical protein
MAEQRLGDKNVKPFDITGKPMSGWLMVKEDGLRRKDDLADWIHIGKRFALTLPEKK